MVTARKYLEITLETAKRLGFYNEVPPLVEGELTQWFVKKGDIIGFTEDKNTGTKVGQVICTITTKNKEEVEIDAQGWEIGAKVLKLLLNEGEIFRINLYKESLKLLELEIEVYKVNVYKVNGEEVQPGNRNLHSVESSETDKGKDTVRVSPLAKMAAKEHGISLQEILAWLPQETKEVNLEHITQFLKNKESRISTQSIKAAPATRRKARELGIDLSLVSGSGPYGIIRMADVTKAVQKEIVTERLPEEKPLTQDNFEVLKPSIRRLAIAQNMTKGALEPLVHPAVDADATALVRLRSELKDFFEKNYGLKLRIDHFFVAACAWLLSKKEFRILNSCWHEENDQAEIRIYKHVNIGLAFAIAPERTQSGFSELIVPVVKHAEQLTFVEIVKAVEELIAKERFGPEDLSDLTFTVNNVGAPGMWRGINIKGVDYPNNPIVPPGTCALLGIGAIREEDEKKKMRLVLGFNHKILDGYEAGLFLGVLRHLIEHPEQILVLK